MNLGKALRWLWAISLLLAGNGYVPARLEAGPAPTVPAGLTPAPGLVTGTLVEGARVDPAQDAPPSPDAASVTDPANPAWQVHYGTRAGQVRVPPSRAPQALRSLGPQLPLVGAWLTITLQAGTARIVATAAARDGRLFAGVANDGLRVYAPGGDGVYGWTAIHAGGGGLASDRVTALAILNNEVWIGTSDAGISALNLDNGTWRQFNTGNSPLPSNTINHISIGWPASFLQGPYAWVATPGGAARYQNAAWTVLNSGNSGLLDDRILDVTVQRLVVGINIYTVTWFSTAISLDRWSGGTNWTHFNRGNTGVCAIDRAARMVVDRYTDVWMAGQQVNPNGPAPRRGAAPAIIDPMGVCRYHQADGSWWIYNSSAPGLPSNVINDLSVDDANRIWAGLSGGAVVFEPTAAASETAVAVYTPGTSPLYNSEVDAVVAAGDQVWFGHGLATVFTLFSPNWLRFTNADVGGAGTPRGILVEATNVWVGLGTGIAWRDAAAWHFRNIPGNPAGVTALARDGAGTLWIATAGNGLFTFDGANTFTHQTTASGLPSNEVRALLADQAGRLWAATASGLALRGNGYWLAFTTNTSPISSNDLTSLTADNTGHIWIGTAANGIAILDPAALGTGAWSTQTTADGLPSNVVKALATDPSGAVWAGTPAGLGQWVAGTWTVFNVANYSLPADDVLSLAADPVGRIWAGTAGGLALRAAGYWQNAFHVTGSTLGGDQVTTLAADENLLWATGGSIVSARGTLTGTIGTFIPVIDSFTPGQGQPYTQITIAGNHFDDRGPAYNRVWIGTQGGAGGVEGVVLTASQTQLVVEVPPLAHSGKLYVESHGWHAESQSEFTVVPAINSLSQACLALGDGLDIWGYGWNSPDLVWVKIGNGVWRQTDYRDPYHIKQFVRPGDTGGVVSVRVGTGGPVVTSNQSVLIGAVQVDGVVIQQGVQGLRMIWGKRTLVQVVLHASGGCTGHVDGGTLDWKWTNNTTSPGAGAYFPGKWGLTVTATAPSQVSLNTAVNFVVEPVAAQPLATFNGVRLTLKNGPVTLLTYDVPAAAFNYADTTGRHRFLIVPILPEVYTANQYANFLAIENQGRADVARVYPEGDGSIDDWMTQANIYYTEPTTITLGSGGAFDRLRGEVDGWRSYINDTYHAGLDQAVALVATELYGGGPQGIAVVDCSDPFDDCSRNTSAVFNRPGISGWPGMAPIFLQETIHGLVWVRPSSPNYAAYNAGHARYDEGRWGVVENCMPAQTFRQASIDQLGFVPRVVWLQRFAKPYQFSLAGCGAPAQMPRSAMSYAPQQYNWSAFLEPLDYNFALGKILQEPQHPQPPQTVTRTLRLIGDLDVSGQVTATLAYPLATVEDLTAPDPFGYYHLLLRAPDNSVVLDQPFSVAFQTARGEEAVLGHFNQRVAFPAGTARAEIRHVDRLLWSRVVSAHAPAVSFVSPNGGGYQAGAVVPVQWTASDPDGDLLQFALDYSPDNGATWLPIAPGLSGSRFDWHPNFVPTGAAARLRLTASDGFNTATSVSAPFALTGRAPVAMIVTPSTGATFVEGETLGLSANAATNSGPDGGSFDWQLNGNPIGSGQSVTHTLDQVGVLTATLRVTDHGLSGSTSLTITVLPDFDRDGMPDPWELAQRLNPLDPSDATADVDGDGLSNREEYQLATAPRAADSDGDAASDGLEVAAGTDPLRADQHPVSAPVLVVGSADLFYTLRSGEPAPDPVTLWISNGGSGALAFTVSSDATWLQVTPTQGTAPTAITLTLATSDLPAGRYVAHITVNAPGAAGSPQTRRVTLEIVRPDGTYAVYLPLARR